MCQYSCIREAIRDTYEIEAIPMIYEEYEDVRYLQCNMYKYINTKYIIYVGTYYVQLFIIHMQNIILLSSSDEGIIIVYQYII